MNRPPPRHDAEHQPEARQPVIVRTLRGGRAATGWPADHQDALHCLPAGNSFEAVTVDMESVVRLRRVVRAGMPVNSESPTRAWTPSQASAWRRSWPTARRAARSSLNAKASTRRCCQVIGKLEESGLITPPVPSRRPARGLGVPANAMGSVLQACRANGYPPTLARLCRPAPGAARSQSILGHSGRARRSWTTSERAATTRDVDVQPGHSQADWRLPHGVQSRTRHTRCVQCLPSRATAGSPRWPAGAHCSGGLSPARRRGGRGQRWYRLVGVGNTRLTVAVD